MSGPEARAVQDADTTLEREFIIYGDSQIGALVRLIENNWRAFAERERPLRVIVTSKDADRLDRDIRFYFGVLLPAMCRQIFVNGQPVDKAMMDFHMRKLFLPHELLTNPMTGEPYVKVQELKRGKIGMRRMREFRMQVEAWAVTEHGVELPPRPAE